ncbi:RloB family protein [Bdellovibrionota bacterium FG-2]
MSLTSRQRRPLDRAKVAFRDARLFIIATEGELTEPGYFKMFRSTRIQIEVLPTQGGASAPKAVLGRLDEYVAKYRLDAEDRLFLVIDRDAWPDKALSEVAQQCATKGHEMAVSNPCFELWIHLHFVEGTTGISSCKDFEDAIRRAVGEYNKANLKPEKFPRDAIVSAIGRAKQLDVSPDDRWPQGVGTHVYRIVEAILPHSRLPNE